MVKPNGLFSHVFPIWPFTLFSIFVSTVLLRLTLCVCIFVLLDKLPMSSRVIAGSAMAAKSHAWHGRHTKINWADEVPSKNVNPKTTLRGGRLAQWLKCLHPTPESLDVILRLLIQLPAIADPERQQGCSSDWFPITHKEDLDWVRGSWLWP